MLLTGKTFLFFFSTWEKIGEYFPWKWPSKIPIKINIEARPKEKLIWKNAEITKKIKKINEKIKLIEKIILKTVLFFNFVFNKPDKILPPSSGKAGIKLKIIIEKFETTKVALKW